MTTVFFFGLYQFAGAQCTEALTEATNEFTDGHLNGIPAILSECIKKGSAEQKVEALKLLTVTYLYLDDPYAAEHSFMELLKIDPEFRVAEDDPIELEYLSRKFITTPIISYSARIGVNYTDIDVINRNTLGNEFDQNWQYRSLIGVMVTGAMDLHFNKVFSLKVEGEFSTRSYEYNDVFEPDIDPQKQNEVRTNMFVSLPVMLKYTYRGAKDYLYFPYIYAGYSPSYTLSSQSTNIRDLKIEGPRLNMAPTVTQFSHSLIFGVGVKRRIRYKYVLIDFRYRLGMTNMLGQKGPNYFVDQAIKDFTFRYLRTPDDYRWNTFELSFGFVWPNYKPRARNSVTIQTVLRNWFGKKEQGNNE